MGIGNETKSGVIINLTVAANAEALTPVSTVNAPGLHTTETLTETTATLEETWTLKSRNVYVIIAVHYIGMKRGLKR